MQTIKTTYIRFPLSKLISINFEDESGNTIITLKGRQHGEYVVDEKEVVKKPKKEALVKLCPGDADTSEKSSKAHPHT